MEKKKKTGRPRKSTDEVKGKQIRVRLTDDEKEKLELMAKSHGVTQSEFIRMLINIYQVAAASHRNVSNKGGKANV